MGYKLQCGDICTGPRGNDDGTRIANDEKVKSDSDGSRSGSKKLKQQAAGSRLVSISSKNESIESNRISQSSLSNLRTYYYVPRVGNAIRTLHAPAQERAEKAS